MRNSSPGLVGAHVILSKNQLLRHRQRGLASLEDSASAVGFQQGERDMSNVGSMREGLGGQKEENERANV